MYSATKSAWIWNSQQSWKHELILIKFKLQKIHKKIGQPWTMCGKCVKRGVIQVRFSVLHRWMCLVHSYQPWGIQKNKKITEGRWTELNLISFIYFLATIQNENEWTRSRLCALVNEISVENDKWEIGDKCIVCCMVFYRCLRLDMDKIYITVNYLYRWELRTLY